MEQTRAKLWRWAWPKRARLWWLVHQWAGLKLSILLTFIFATGTLAVLSHEIDWLFHPSLRVDMATVEGETNWEAIATAALAQPETASIRSIDAPEAGAFAAQVTITRPDGSLAFLNAHPTTGEIQGVQSWVGAQRILRNMHRHLNMPLDIGVPLVSVLSFLLLASFFSSLVVYKRWWRGFFRPIRWRNARTALGDLHRLSGVWSLWFVLLMAVTGVWYFAESVGLQAPPAVAEKAETVIAPAEAATALPPSLTVARQEFPGLALDRIIFPTRPGQAFRFEGHADAILVRPRANAVWTEPATAEVLAVRHGEELSLHQRISEAADPLHFGYFGGYWTKLIWFVFGLALTFLAVSGVAIYAARLVRKTREGGPGAIRLAWNGMGVWKWPATAAVLAGFVLLYPLVVGPR
ncbi:PepSY-associated TM helix domain-containing protein [Henriciella aquimarina]|uniref:PepSY-associated TM helix domain-containing protein n=1 Tax=Henriciella aquimarina TaxID=545261 RepID=UPI0009FDD607|nr:PepSY-associated TM helix domain-containing protein [Henriciella aquimarina]